MICNKINGLFLFYDWSQNAYHHQGCSCTQFKKPWCCHPKKQIGSDYTTIKYKSYTDTDTGIRKNIAVERRVKAWWFTADNNKLALQIKYGNRVIELQKGKPTIELNSISELESTLKLIQTAVENGELDKEINLAAEQLRDNFVNT